MISCIYHVYIEIVDTFVFYLVCCSCYSINIILLDCSIYQLEVVHVNLKQ